MCIRVKPVVLQYSVLIEAGRLNSTKRGVRNNGGGVILFGTLRSHLRGVPSQKCEKVSRCAAAPFMLAVAAVPIGAFSKFVP